MREEKCPFHGGMNLREFDQYWLRLGGVRTPLPGTGEALYHHPVRLRWARISVRRKDAPRILVSLGRALYKEVEREGR